MEAWRLKIEARRACMPVVRDSHHLNEEQVQVRMEEKS
jgi:hypothetical protein